LTIHNIISSDVSCYIWSEPIAKREANDRGSYLFDYLGKFSNEINHVIMYSDCFEGQIKNSIIRQFIFGLET